MDIVRKIGEPSLRLRGDENMPDKDRLQFAENVEKGGQDRPKVDVIIVDCGEVSTCVLVAFFRQLNLFSSVRLI
jgi:hypothetical protein